MTLLRAWSDAGVRRSWMCCGIGSQGASGWVHFVGIGGTGLSALALLAVKQGWKVSGSDAAWSSRLESLERAGVTVYNGHSASQLQRSPGCMPDTVVVSSAIPADNVELRAARSCGIRVLKRSDWLAESTKNYDLIAIAGTHGKSTTTAMLAVVLQSLGVDITAIVGADVRQFPGGANVLCGNGRHFLLEADEYDSCFLGGSPSLAVITNVEWEHVDMFPDEASTREMFKRFVARIEPNGCLVICGDSAGARSLTSNADDYSTVNKMKSLKVITYGLHERNDWRALMLVTNSRGGTDYLAVYRNMPMAQVSLKMPGLHNVLNSLAAIVAASTLGLKGSTDDSHQLRAMSVTAQAASKALRTFEGLSRRFDFIGAVRGCLIYDDYAHHPTEIRAVLQAARERHHANPLWVVFQPHTYSRLAKLLDDFASAFSAADRVIVTEVFSAREENVWNISGSDLAFAVKGPPAVFIATLDGVIERLSSEIMSFEKFEVNNRGNIILLTLGAGDVTTIGPKLFDALAASKPQD